MTTDAWPAGRRGSLILLGASLGWLGWMLWSAQASILGANDGVTAIIVAASALPVVIAATMLAGAAAGQAAQVWRPVAAALRWALTTGAGALVGAVAAALILWGYGHRSSIVQLAVSVLIAGTLGGALAGIRPAQVVSVGLAGALGASVADSALSLFTVPLMRLFGGGGSPAAWLAAASRLALTASLIGGAVAGLTAFALLYRARCGWRFPVYLGAGAGAGMLLLVTELVTRVGGIQIFGIVGRLSPADPTYLAYVAQSRLDYAMIVLFVGAIVALLCLGATMRRPESESAAPR